MTRLDRQNANLDISSLNRQKENKVRNYYNRLLNFTSTNDSTIITKYKSKSYKTTRTKKQMRESKHENTNTVSSYNKETQQRLTMKKHPVILND